MNKFYMSKKHKILKVYMFSGGALITYLTKRGKIITLTNDSGIISAINYS